MEMNSCFSQRLRALREAVRWRGAFIAAVLTLREILRPLFYFHVWHIFEIDISQQVSSPYGELDPAVKVYAPDDGLMITQEQISAMGELGLDEVSLRFTRGDLIAVAVVKEQPVGYMWIALSGGSEIAFDTYWIVRSHEALKYGSFVLPAFRGRGIHSCLNSAVNSYFHKRGILRALGSVGLLNPQSMSLPKHYNRAISMTLFVARIRGIDWTIRKSFRAPLESRFSWRQDRAILHSRR
jgi:GNAT superfamily N-acetyltransferase